VYRGPVISHETLCEINHSPFSAPKKHSDDVVTRKDAAIIQTANQLVADLERKQGDEGRGAFRFLDDRHDGDAGSFSSRVLADGWTSDGLLLLTRAEHQRAKCISGSQDTSGTSKMDGSDVGGGVSGGLTNLKRESEHTAMETFSGIPPSSWLPPYSPCHESQGTPRVWS
jgi:hypothetical protein